MDKGFKPAWPREEEIEHLVLQTEEFIVFIDKKMDVDWATNDNYKAGHSTGRKAHNEILVRAAKLECIPSDHHVKNVRINYKRMIGEAIARSLENDERSAHRMLEDAQEYIQERNTEKSRYWFLSSSGTVAIVVSAFGYLAWCIRAWFLPFLGETAFFLALAMTAGSLGALLSVVMRLGKTAMNPAAGRNLHYLEGTFRVVSGCISALIVSMCVQAGILLPIFVRVNSTHLAMILSGLIAGTSERLAPSLISRIDVEHLKKSKSGTGPQTVH